MTWSGLVSFQRADGVLVGGMERIWMKRKEGEEHVSGGNSVKYTKTMRQTGLSQGKSSLWERIYAE